jgi:hypothetical protein
LALWEMAATELPERVGRMQLPPAHAERAAGSSRDDDASDAHGSGRRSGVARACISRCVGRARGHHSFVM